MKITYTTSRTGCAVIYKWKKRVAVGKSIASLLVAVAKMQVKV